MRRITLIPKGVVFVNNKPSVYINSPDGEVMFDGIGCKKVGTLGFRSQLTFNAPSDAVEIFLAFENGSDAPELVKYQIPEGQSDVEMNVSGKSITDIGFSNYERRSNIFSRMDGGKRVLLIIAAVVVFIILIHGLSHTNNFLRSISKIPEAFETDDMSITLSRAFVKVRQEDFYAFYMTRSCSVVITKESFEDIPELKNVDFDEYCEMCIKANPAVTPALVNREGLTYFVFEQQWEELYKYHVYVYRTDDAYWLVQFSTKAADYNYWSDCYNEWAKSVEFK